VNIRKFALPFILSVAGIVFALLLTGTAKVYHIPTSGMSPTINPGDYVTATRLFSPAEKVAKGQLVIFDSSMANPKGGGKFLQRVAAIGGDTVDQIDGRLHVNGQPLRDRNGKVPRGPKPNSVPPGMPAPKYPLVIPQGQIFTLGDNHDNSLDSRYFGPFPADAVTHRPHRIIFPLSRAGKIE